MENYFKYRPDKNMVINKVVINKKIGDNVNLTLEKIFNIELL